MDMTALRALMLRGGGTGGGGGAGSIGELYKSYTYDKKLIEDGIKESLPTYSTSAQTLVSEAELENVTVDYDNYLYFLFQRSLTTPIYNTDNTGLGRVEYNTINYLAWPYLGPKDIPCIVDPSKTFNQSQTDLTVRSGRTATVYWTNMGTIDLTTGYYGGYQTFSTITASGNTISIKSPAILIRGNATYFTSTYWSAMTDIRCQYVIELYRLPKHGEFHTLFGQYEHIFDCIRANDHKLT